jgi:hypothetical protein
VSYIEEVKTIERSKEINTKQTMIDKTVHTQNLKARSPVKTVFNLDASE